MIWKIDIADMVAIIVLLLTVGWFRIAYRSWKKDYRELKKREDSSGIERIDITTLHNNDNSWKKN